MKKLNCLLFAAMFTACNNENSKTGESKNADKSLNAQSASATSGGGCASLVLFRKGTVLEAVSYDKDGKQSAKQTTTVKEVVEDGGMTVATSSAESTSSLGKKSYDLVYKCDGKNLYMDLNSMMQNVGLKDVKAEARTLSFPIQMTAGETLPESSFTMDMSRGGNNMKIKTSYVNRKVGPLEKVTVPAGTWDCFKVSADIVSDIEGLDAETKKIMDAVKEKTKMQMNMWVAQGFGMVKMEMLMGGKRSSYTEITSVK